MRLLLIEAYTNHFSSKFKLQSKISKHTFYTLKMMVLEDSAT